MKDLQKKEFQIITLLVNDLIRDFFANVAIDLEAQLNCKATFIELNKELRKFFYYGSYCDMFIKQGRQALANIGRSHFCENFSKSR